MEYNNIRNLAKDRFYFDAIKENYKYSNFAIGRVIRDSCSTVEKQRFNIVLTMIQRKTYEYDLGKVLQYIYGLPIFQQGIITTLYNLTKKPCYTTNIYKLVLQDIIEAAYGTKKTDFFKYTFLLDTIDKENILLEENDLIAELELTVPTHDVPKPTDEIKNIIISSGWMGLYYIIKLLYNMPIKRC